MYDKAHLRKYPALEYTIKQFNAVHALQLIKPQVPACLC